MAVQLLSKANVSKRKIISRRMIGMIATLMADPESPHPAVTRPRVRVSRPPRLDPPYDDERDQPAGPPLLDAVADQPQRPLRDAPDAGQTPGSDRPPATPTSTRAALAYVRLCIEVLNGYRPPSHVRRLGGPVEFADVIDQFRRRQNSRDRAGATAHPAAVAARTTTSSRALNSIPAQRLAGQRSARAANPPAFRDHPTGGNHAASAAAVGAGQISPNGSARWAPVSLVRLRVSEPLDGVAEAVAVLSHAGSSCAMALRLERTAGTWTCALAQVI
jgi:uncharacterized protein DUF6459